MKYLGTVLIIFFVATSALYAAETLNRYATISEMEGEVLVAKSSSENWQKAEPNAMLVEGDVIKTGPNSSATILVDENGAAGDILIRENSTMKIASLIMNQETADKDTVLDLAIGKVLVHANKLEGNSNFAVKTPTSMAGVRGTMFEVEVTEENKE